MRQEARLPTRDLPSLYSILSITPTKTTARHAAIYTAGRKDGRHSHQQRPERGSNRSVMSLGGSARSRQLSLVVIPAFRCGHNIGEHPTISTTRMEICTRRQPASCGTRGTPMVDRLPVSSRSTSPSITRRNQGDGRFGAALWQRA